MKEDDMRIKLAIIGAIILTSLCVAAQEVRTHYDKSYDFSKAKTFTIKIGTRWGNPTNEEYSKAVIAEDLTAKGYTPAAPDSSADLLVVIHGATQDRTSVQSFYSGTGVENFGWAGPAGTSSTWETQYKVGTGVVDIFDTKTRKLVFRGVAEDEISPQGEENQKKIDNASTKMFKDFPSRAKS
jgi:Domain of unknown function (DUF4136)